MVKITVLNDNTPGRHFLAEHGLSFHIQTENYQVLLDAGASDVFTKNATSLGLDLNKLDMVVLSHGHWDHGNGLRHLRNLTLVAHPAIFTKRYHLDCRKDYVGLDMTKYEMEDHFEILLSAAPVLLNDDIVFLGEIPRGNEFEALTTSFVDHQGNPDFVPDDSGVVIKTEKGLVVISGCAHAGICNTVKYASELMEEKRILAVMGGFHLKKNDELTHKTIETLQNMGVKYVYPSHCTDLPALAQFYNVFKMNRIKTGDVIKF